MRYYHVIIPSIHGLLTQGVKRWNNHMNRDRSRHERVHCQWTMLPIDILARLDFWKSPRKLSANLSISPYSILTFCSMKRSFSKISALILCLAWMAVWYFFSRFNICFFLISRNNSWRRHHCSTIFAL